MTVDLVNHDDWFQATRKGLHSHEARLWHWAILGINDQQYTINHRHHTLNFTTEIGVTWGVNDVNPVFLASFFIGPTNRGVLG